MRSRLSPEGGQNQKWYFKAKTGTFLINSYELRANYVKSYKKFTKRLKILKSLHLQWGLGQNRGILQEICIDFQIAILGGFSCHKTNSRQTK